MTDLTLKITKKIQAPIERVFEAWLNPETLSRFMMPMPGMDHPKVQCDPKLGGKFEILMDVGGNLVSHSGEYVALERPNKLAFTWVSPASLEDSVVTIELSSVGETATNIALTQVKFIDEQHRSNHEGGWSNILSSLDGLLT